MSFRKPSISAFTRVFDALLARLSGIHNRDLRDHDPIVVMDSGFAAHLRSTRPGMTRERAP